MRKILVALMSLAVVIAAAYPFLFRKKTPAQRLSSLGADVAEKSGQVFQANVNGHPLAFLLQNCDVYMLDVSTDKVKRTKVLDAGFYLGFTVCTRQSITASEEYILVTLGKTAIGAGGCCAAGGNYRSKDGVKWEKDTAKGWRPVEEAQA